MQITRLPVKDQLIKHQYAYYVVVNDSNVIISVFENIENDSANSTYGIKFDQTSEYDIDKNKDQLIDWIKNPVVSNKNDRNLSGSVIHLTDLSDQYTNVSSVQYWVYCGRILFDITSIKNRRDFSLYILPFNSNTGTTRYWVEKMGTTYNLKSSIRDFIRKEQFNDIGWIFVPSKGSNLTDSNNSMLMFEPDNIVYDIRSENVTLSDLLTTDDLISSTTVTNHFPTIELIGSDTIIADQSETYTIHVKNPDGSLIDYPLTVDLESTSGYIPVRKIDTNNGIGSFTIYSDRVPSNTIIKIKCNVDNFTNVGNKSIVVI